MNLNVIDEETIKVSDNVHYEVTKLGNHHVITIDNVLEKISYMRNLIDKSSNQVRLEVDGGINPENISIVSEAGADTFVLGSAIFNTDDYSNTISTLRRNIS